MMGYWTHSTTSTTPNEWATTLSSALVSCREDWRDNHILPQPTDMLLHLDHVAGLLIKTLPNQ
jgi:hypothetical protein